MGASFGDLMVGAVTGGGMLGFDAYGKSLARQEEFSMQQLLENSKALKEEHMAEVSKLNTIEVNKANIANQTEADKSAWGSEGYRTKADEAAHGPGGYATRGQIEVNKRQGEMQIKVAQAAAGIAATAKGRETAAAIAQIKSLGLSPEQEQRAIVAEVTKLDLMNPKNELSTQYSSIYRANSTLVDNDPAYEKASAAEKAAAADTMTKIQLGQTLSTGVVEDELGSVITSTPKPVIPTTPPVPVKSRVPATLVRPGLLSSPTSSQAPYKVDTEKIKEVGRGVLGGAKEVFSNTSASELGRNAKENVKRWTGIK
jgi:hypothetical protein